MDSEHRHELKENDLAVAITTLKDWWAKHQMKVLGGAVVLAALILAIRYFSASATASRDNEQYALATAPTPEAFRSLAQDTSNDAVKLHANLRGADAILPLVRKPAGVGADAISEDKKKQLLDQGESMYQSVLDAAKHPLIRIKARLGLAALAETRGQWDKAKEQYLAIQNEPGEGLEFLKKRAASFAASLEKIQVTPVFGKEVKESPLGGGKDPLGFPFPLDAKDGKTNEAPEKGPFTPSKTPDTKDAKTPDPSPTKDAKVPDPVPTKDAKTPAPTPTPAPTKDAKEPAPAKDAKDAKVPDPAAAKDAKTPTP